MPASLQPSSSHRPRRLLGSPGVRLATAALLASHAALLLAEAERPRPLRLLVLAAAFGAWLWAVRALEGSTGAGGGGILPVALALRALCLPLEPTALSDDILRYVWDGRVVLAGFDPYRLAPEAAALAPLRDARWERMPHRQVATVYPPLAQAVFAAGAVSPWPERTLKIILIALDGLAVFLLLRLARALGRPPARVAWYAWCPLVSLEVAGAGHVEALGVAAMVGAVLCLARRPERPLPFAAAAAAAVLAKLVPLVALPLWARRMRRPWPALGLALGLVAVGLLPMLAGGPPPGLVAYGLRWEHAGPLFEPLARGLEAARASEAIKAGLDAAKAASGHAHDEAWNRVYPFVYPQLLAKLVLAAGFLAFLVLEARRREADVVAETGRVLGGLLLAMATVYPWYLLWVLPWAALGRHRAWLAATAGHALTYLGLAAPDSPWTWALAWLPFALVLPFSRWSTS